MSKYIDVAEPHRLITPGSVILVSVGNSKEDNIFSVAWNMPVRKNPAMVAILCGKRHYSYKFMSETGEFGINIPDAKIAKQVIQCGKVSGYDLKDKFSEFGLTRVKSEYIKAPLIEEAVARLECRICQTNDMGASALIIAQILNAKVDPKHFNGDSWNFDNGFEMLHHLGGSDFVVSDKAMRI